MAAECEAGKSPQSRAYMAEAMNLGGADHGCLCQLCAVHMYDLYAVFRYNPEGMLVPHSSYGYYSIKVSRICIHIRPFLFII